jgi:hypothetical protein
MDVSVPNLNKGVIKQIISFCSVAKNNVQNTMESGLHILDHS